MLLANRRIFIVEDNIQNRVIYNVVLSRQGALVDFERAGAGAVFRLTHIPQVDVVVLDLMLAEGVSGLDLFDQIRAIPKYTTVPIVAVSAMDQTLAVPKVRAKGFQGFIAKPIDKDIFPRQIARLITGHEVWSNDLESVE